MMTKTPSMAHFKPEKHVHGLWIRGPLSPMEWLTIHSFIYHGFTFYLWTYEKEPYTLPENAFKKDAREIIPENKIFTYQSTNQFGHGKGSFAGFSDIFRYALLYKYGGWWTDMDVTCLDRLDFQQPYVFRGMKNSRVAVGNIMYAEPNSALMEWCYREAMNKITSDNRDWLLPLRILNDGIRHFGLNGYILSFTNNDSWPLVRKYLLYDKSLNDWKAFHWMNEEFRRLSIPKDYVIMNSTLEQQMRFYDIQPGIVSGTELSEYKRKAGLMNYLKVNWRLFPSWIIRGGI
jgi:hypothetical protein